MRRADARAGMLAFASAPRAPPAMPVTISAGRIVVRSYAVKPSSPAAGTTPASAAMLRLVGTVEQSHAFFRRHIAHARRRSRPPRRGPSASCSDATSAASAWTGLAIAPP